MDDLSKEIFQAASSMPPMTMSIVATPTSGHCFGRMDGSAREVGKMFGNALAALEQQIKEVREQFGASTSFPEFEMGMEDAIRFARSDAGSKATMWRDRGSRNGPKQASDDEGDSESRHP